MIWNLFVWGIHRPSEYSPCYKLRLSSYLPRTHPKTSLDAFVEPRKKKRMNILITSGNIVQLNEEKNGTTGEHANWQFNSDQWAMSPQSIVACSTFPRIIRPVIFLPCFFPPLLTYFVLSKRAAKYWPRYIKPISAQSAISYVSVEDIKVWCCVSVFFVFLLPIQNPNFHSHACNSECARDDEDNVRCKNAGIKIWVVHW